MDQPTAADQHRIRLVNHEVQEPAPLDPDSVASCLYRPVGFPSIGSIG